MPRSRPAVQELLTPPALWERYDALCDERPDVRTTRYILEHREAQQQWLHSVGVTSDPTLAALVPPLPPEHLRSRVAAPEPELFLWTGFIDLALVLELFERDQRLPAGPPYRALDFGSGCGRLMRFFHGAQAEWEVHGADVNPELVAWSRENLAWAQHLESQPHPPLDLPDGCVDLVYSLSVFSHLSEEPAAAWLRELGRLIRPGGTLIATTHGRTALETIRESPVHQDMFAMTAAEADDTLRRLPTEGFLHRRYADPVLEVARAGDDYGNCFVDPGYVAARWTSPHFELCDHRPGGLRGWQDVLVLRRLADAP